MNIGRMMILSLLILTLTSVGFPEDGDQPIRLGKHRQLFVDHHLIAGMKGVKQVLNQPRKHPLNPIIVADRPWEGGGVAYPNGVAYDEKTGFFSMYYKANYPYAVRACRAVSHDGIHWTKPNLGLVEFESSKANNLYRGKSGGPQGFHTPWDPDPQKQYKMMAGRHGPGMFSPDGIHWTTPPESQKIPNVASDSSVRISYDKVNRRYFGFSKTVITSGGHGRRCWGITFSDDYLQWTPMKAILVPDARDDELARQRVAKLRDHVTHDDGPDWHVSQFYTMRHFPYEGMYIGLLQKFDVSGFPPNYKKILTAGGEDGLGYYELVSSRDTEHWDRAGNRDIFLPVGDVGTWEAGWLDFPQPPIIVGDEMRFYYGAFHETHSTPWIQSDQPDDAARTAAVARLQKQAKEKGMKYSASAIGLATLRLDGWVSIDAGMKEGTLTTKPLVFEGDILFINSTAPHGRVAVEILDQQSRQPIPGFSKTDCDTFSGDAIRHQVRWKGKSDLSKLAGKAIQIRFYLQKAKLYSFAIVKS